MPLPNHSQAVRTYLKIHGCFPTVPGHLFAGIIIARGRAMSKPVLLILIAFGLSITASPVAAQVTATNRLCDPAYENCRTGLLELMKKRSEEHTSELQSRLHLVCRLLLEKKKTKDCSRMNKA